ncbi:MAG TPA: LD-carboxypeptidase [Thermoanaerobaculia bacterium]|nr:LD-carboxypeptidase [Thermoanaerobaculia bacterium]
MTTRRDFLAGAGLAAGGSLLGLPGGSAAPASPDAMVKPRALRAGDTVGLIAPSSYIFDLSDLEGVAPRLEALGLECRFGRNVRARRGYLAGTEEERLADLHAMFADPSIAAVFCLGGGYGSERLLARVDYALVRKNPKIFLGYSDITGLHLALGKLARLVTFHGPVALSALPPWTLGYLKKALFAPEPMGPIENPPEKDVLSPEFPRHTIVPGRALGRTVGGNLTLIATTMGTPYEIDTKGKILLLEDTGEAPYRVDRMLVQLALAGKLADAAGIVWGTCTDCAPSRSGFEINLSMSELLDDLLSKLGKPVLAGLVFGHTPEKATIPLGVEAELDATAKTFTLLETATAAP